MIILLQGTPGSGKSYEATVFHALRAVKRGRKVITNLPLNAAAFAELDPEYPDLIEIREDPDPDTPIFSKVEHYQTSWKGRDAKTGKDIGPIYIVDECHRCLGIDRPVEDVADWYAMHRHRGCDIVLITQSHHDVARTIKNRIDHFVQLENLKRKGFGSVYMRRVYSDTGFRARPEGEMTRSFEKRYFALYDSYTQGGSGLELGTSDTRKWYLEPRLIMIAVILVVALSGAIYGVYNLLTSDFPSPSSALALKSNAKPKPTPQPVAQPAPQKSRVPTMVLDNLEDLSTVRYAGVLSSDQGNLFLFVLDSGRSVTYSMNELRSAGYLVTEVSSCRIAMKHSNSIRVLSC